jgi:hypothetical protein
MPLRRIRPHRTTKEREKKEREYENGNWMSLIIAKKKDVVLLLLSLSLSLPRTSCSDITNMYTRNSCAEEKRKKIQNETKTTSRDLYIDVRWLFAQIGHSFTCLKEKYNASMEGQRQYNRCEIRLYKEKKREKDLFLSLNQIYFMSSRVQKIKSDDCRDFMTMIRHLLLH